MGVIAMMRRDVNTDLSAEKGQNYATNDDC